MVTIYIYSNVDGKQVASYSAETNEECERWAQDTYGTTDYHWSYVDVPVSNAV